MACVLSDATHYTIKFGRCPTLNKIYHEDTKFFDRIYRMIRISEVEGALRVLRGNTWGSRLVVPSRSELLRAQPALLRQLCRLAKRVGFTIYEVLRHGRVFHIYYLFGTDTDLHGRTPRRAGINSDLGGGGIVENGGVFWLTNWVGAVQNDY